MAAIIQSPPVETYQILNPLLYAEIHTQKKLFKIFAPLTWKTRK